MKNEFLSSLSRLLNGIPENDKNEILYDYEEHFRIGMEEGKTEEEIVRFLGDVRAIARQFKASYTIEQAEKNASTGNIFRAVLATVGLGFFNLVVVFGPFMGFVGALTGLFVAAIGLTAAGIGLLAATAFSPYFAQYINTEINLPFAVFFSIGLTSFGLLFLIGDCYLAKYFYRGTIKYLKWNLDIIKR